MKFKNTMAGMVLVAFLAPTLTGCASTGQGGGSFVSEHPVATGVVLGAAALVGLGAIALAHSPGPMMMGGPLGRGG